jgi:hypothetical protein
LNSPDRRWKITRVATSSPTRHKTYQTCAQFGDATLDFPRGKVRCDWVEFCDSVTDNFRVINPKDFRVVA